MKLKILILSIATFLIIFSCEENSINPSNDINPSLDDYKLSKILNYSSSTSSEPYNFVEFEYDNKGKLIKESMIDYPNTLATYKLYEYADDKLTKVKIYDGQVGSLTLGTYINYFYTNDKITKEELRLGDGTLKYTTYSEFNGNNLINTYKVDDQLGIHHQYKYTYDNKNRLTLEQVYMYDQELSEFTKYFYDELDRLTKTELYDHNSTLTLSVGKQYEGASRLPIKELQYDKDGTLTQTRQLSYDQWNNLIETNVNGSCTIFKRKYNGQLLTEQITYGITWGCSEWTVSRYEYIEK